MNYMSLHTLNSPAVRRFALFDLGFRPFYLLAGAYAALGAPIWALQYAGVLPGANMLWHAHEMLFGYAFAVIAGFLLTAVRNWTGLPTPTGAALAGIAALWLAGRLLALFSLPAAAGAGALFAVALAWGIGVPLVRSGNRRNLFLVALVLAMGAGGVALQAWPRLGMAIGLDVVLFVMVVIAGRVLPMFTNNAVPGAGARRDARVEIAAIASLPVLFALEAAGLALAASWAALAAAALHGLRLALWAPHRSVGKPILWILHLSYAWIVVHLALRGLAGLDLLLPMLADHALSVGAIGGMTLGMMTRTARGHTGRTLAAGRAEVAAYVLVQAAAVVRVVVPLTLPASYPMTILASALLWCAAFALFVIAYFPILTRARVDGMPG
jgi:uncharacterized protein involved in response to NO